MKYAKHVCRCILRMCVNICIYAVWKMIKMIIHSEVRVVGVETMIVLLYR